MIAVGQDVVGVAPAVATSHTAVLLVEDSADVATEVTSGLQRLGMTVNAVGSGAAALDNLVGADAVVLDVGLPDMDGFEVCRLIRTRSDVPIVFLSGRTDEFDRVLALKLGADDYMVKPCGIRELAARLDAVVRRARSRPADPPAAEGDEVHRVGGLDVDRGTRQATLDGERLALSRKEFDLLALLAAQPGKVLTRDAIMLEVWGYDSLGDTRTLGVHIAGLRKKLGSADLIETVRGIGFRVRA